MKSPPIEPSDVLAANSDAAGRIALECAKAGVSATFRGKSGMSFFVGLEKEAKTCLFTSAYKGRRF